MHAHNYAKFPLQKDGKLYTLCLYLLHHSILSLDTTMKPSNFLLIILIIGMATRASRAYLPGAWELLLENAGIASMHTAVTRFNTVILLGQHYSSLFDLDTKKVRPLTIVHDTWCSSAQFLPNGTLLHTGGSFDGYKKIRMFTPCETTLSCDWEELEDIELAQGRWYATNQILPNGSVIMVGGNATFSVELFPPTIGIRAVNFPFLAETNDAQMDNLYPYVHLLPNGHLFVFANNKCVLYDYTKNIVLKRYPELEGGPRNYPSAGSSVMLALTRDYSSATIVVCGGAQYGAFSERNTSAPARSSCGRIVATKKNPVWEMESMPFGRIMGDMVMLPTGDVLIINGAQVGTQGFELASKPCLNPVLYKPDEPVGSRFITQTPGSVPRMYHSTANLLPDGRVLLAGSNPHYYYNFSGEFPTQLKVEAFSPEYLSPDKEIIRPKIMELPEKIHYGGGFNIVIVGEIPVRGFPEVNIMSAPFATHSFSQGQRLVKLAVLNVAANRPGTIKFACMAPLNSNVAPPGYYMVFVVDKGVPSVAKWMQLL